MARLPGSRKPRRSKANFDDVRAGRIKQSYELPDHRSGLSGRDRKVVKLLVWLASALAVSAVALWAAADVGADREDLVRLTALEVDLARFEQVLTAESGVSPQEAGLERADLTSIIEQSFDGIIGWMYGDDSRVQVVVRGVQVADYHPGDALAESDAPAELVEQVRNILSEAEDLWQRAAAAAATLLAAAVLYARRRGARGGSWALMHAGVRAAVSGLAGTAALTYAAAQARPGTLTEVSEISGYLLAGALEWNLWAGWVLVLGAAIVAAGAAAVYRAD